MNPPVYKTIEDMFRQIEFCGYECEAGKLEMNVAYIQLKESLRWHDAVKDPPKKGIYPCKWIGGFDWVACKFNNGKWLLWGDEVHPDLYFPLPEPPKEEKE